jgi:hypothetical protein
VPTDETKTVTTDETKIRVANGRQGRSVPSPCEPSSRIWTWNWLWSGCIRGEGRTGRRATVRLADTGVQGDADSRLRARGETDCVVCMPETHRPRRRVCDAVGRINIGTSAPIFFNPDAMAKSLREGCRVACLRGQSSIHATGSSPGFATEALPLLVMSLSGGSTFSPSRNTRTAWKLFRGDAHRPYGIRRFADGVRAT